MSIILQVFLYSSLSVENVLLWECQCFHWRDFNNKKSSWKRLNTSRKITGSNNNKNRETKKAWLTYRTLSPQHHNISIIICISHSLNIHQVCKTTINKLHKGTPHIAQIDVLSCLFVFLLLLFSLSVLHRLCIAHHTKVALLDDGKR